MVNPREDQAEGLRRMLSFSRARTIAVVAGTRGAGATSCVVNLASALARQGSRVLVVDENFDSNISHAFGLRPRHDLKHVIQGEVALDDALLHGPSGIFVLAAATAARTLPRLDRASQARAIDCFAELDELADIVLLDVRNDELEPSPFAAATQEVIVVVSPGAASITGGYSAIKRMSRGHWRRSFRLLVNRAQDFANVRTVEANMRDVARKHLDVALEVMDAIPLDPAVVVSSRRFCAAVDAAPTAAASRQFCEHAAGMLRWSAAHDDVSRLDTFMQRAIHGSRFQAAGAGV
jgi:flagellar biosynthesis protein FlhG